MNLSRANDPRMEDLWLKAGALGTKNGPVVNPELRQALKTLKKIEGEIAQGRKTRSCGIGKGSVSLAVLKKAAQARIAGLQAPTSLN